MSYVPLSKLPQLSFKFPLTQLFLGFGFFFSLAVPQHGICKVLDLQPTTEWGTFLPILMGSAVINAFVLSTALNCFTLINPCLTGSQTVDKNLLLLVGSVFKVKEGHQMSSIQDPKCVHILTGKVTLREVAKNRYFMVSISRHSEPF